MDLEPALLHKLDEDGYVVVRDVLSKREIKRLRSLLYAHFAKGGIEVNAGLTQPNAAIEVEGIGELLHHKNVLALMRYLLGRSDIMFTNHCDMHWRTLSGWHKDDGVTVIDGGYFGRPMYDSNVCRVYKVAFYLQDHSCFTGGGLTVRKGSHRDSSIESGEEVYLSSRAGDAIIFDVRLSHAGQMDVVPNALMKAPTRAIRRLATDRLGVAPQKFDQALKSFIDRITKGKGAVFFTYGYPDNHTKTFAIKNMQRQLRQTTNLNIYLSQSDRQKFIEHGVALAEDYFSDHLQKTTGALCASDL